MLELLNQLDGFDERGDVKVIMATNKIESLDPALIRPGRIDRKIEFPLPDIKTKRNIFKIHTGSMIFLFHMSSPMFTRCDLTNLGKMSLADDVDLEVFVMSKDELSGKFCPIMLRKILCYLLLLIFLYLHLCRCGHQSGVH